MALEILDVEQRSDAWYQARLGIPTASQYSAILANGRGGAPSKTRLTYLRKLAGERITGQPAEDYRNAYMDRGREMEDEARGLYAFATGTEPRLVGFGRNHGTGASPDALIGDDGMLEIKTSAPHLLIGIIEDGHFRPSTFPSCRATCGVRAAMDRLVDLLPGHAFVSGPVERDDRYIDGKLAPAVRAFVGELEAIVARVSRAVTEGGAS